MYRRYSVKPSQGLSPMVALGAAAWTLGDAEIADLTEAVQEAVREQLLRRATGVATPPA